MNSPDTSPPDVFVSYARENRAIAEQLAEGLSASGLQVWWDRNLVAGSEFASVIEARLLSAAVVIVLWSSDSVRSSFVRDESSRALKQGKLLPVRIEDLELPLGFGQLHTLDLLDWDGDAGHEGFQALLFEVRQRRQQAPGLPALVRPGRRWPRRRSLIAGVALALVLGGAAYWFASGQQAEKQSRIDTGRLEADRHFRAGLDQQYASVPQLETALNEYLSVLELRPAHARARYYLGHVYAQTGKPTDALDAFKQALLATEAPLDRSQRADAEKQLRTLATVEGEAAPITRVAETREPAKPAPGSPAIAPPPVPAALTKLPPRIDPPEASVAQLTQSVDGMFDPNKERRINATTSLVLDPQALSDAVPIAVRKATQVLKNGPAGLDASASSGVVNTLVLLQSALPGTLLVNRQAIDQLGAAEPLGDYTAKQAGKVRDLLGQAATRRPVAYIQIANEAQRPIAEALTARLRSFGYEAPGIELVGDRAPDATQVRVQGKSDRSYARWVRKIVAEAIDAQPASSGLRNAKPRTDTYEIWLGRALCAPGGRLVAGCAGAYRAAVWSGQAALPAALEQQSARRMFFNVLWL